MHQYWYAVLLQYFFADVNLQNAMLCRHGQHKTIIKWFMAALPLKVPGPFKMLLCQPQRSEVTPKAKVTPKAS